MQVTSAHSYEGVRNLYSSLIVSMKRPVHGKVGSQHRDFLLCEMGLNPMQMTAIFSTRVLSDARVRSRPTLLATDLKEVADGERDGQEGEHSAEQCDDGCKHQACEGRTLHIGLTTRLHCMKSHC